MLIFFYIDYIDYPPLFNYINNIIAGSQVSAL